MSLVQHCSTNGRRDDFLQVSYYKAYSTLKVTSNRISTKLANLCKFYSQHQTVVSTPLQILALCRPVCPARASKVKWTCFQSHDPASSHMIRPGAESCNCVCLRSAA